MKILINCSNLKIGGALQVADSVINELVGINEHYDCHIIMSETVYKNCQYLSDSKKLNLYRITHTIGSLNSFLKSYNALSNLEEKLQPDVVFTIFGPAYWRPKSIHVVGFADGWVYNPGNLAEKRLKVVSKWKRIILSMFKAKVLQIEANHLIVETQDAKEKIGNLNIFPYQRISVVGNTVSNYFLQDYSDMNRDYNIILPPKNDKEFRLLYPAFPHPNKNFELIKEILKEKHNSINNIHFILTLPKNLFNEIFHDCENVINVGLVAPQSCPSLYSQCDALFMPSLLETFSASYPESMMMSKPILTSNLSFAKELCGNAAIYFDPQSAEDALDKIKMVIDDFELRGKLISRGKKRLDEFETASTRAQKYLNICQKHAIK